MNTEIRGEIILITGASSGIGRALAKRLCPHNTVLACGRSERALTRLAEYNSNINPVVFDVTNESRLTEVKDSLETTVERIDRVILCAGICEYPNVDDLEISTYQSLSETNYIGWINTLKISLNLLKKSETKHLIGVSSQAIFAPFPLAGAYGASKAAATYFIKSAAIDLWQHDIQCSLIYPGFVDTPLTRKNTFKMPFLMTVDEAAGRMITAIAKRRNQYIFPKRLYALLLLARVFPKLWNKFMANNTN